jgi:hypothetical protein
MISLLLLVVSILHQESVNTVGWPPIVWWKIPISGANHSLYLVPYYVPNFMVHVFVQVILLLESQLS